MDRTAFAACAIVWLGLPLATGCGVEPAPPPADPAPWVLAELRAASPGPWRHQRRAPITVTALERALDSRYAPPAPLEEADEPRHRWDAGLAPTPAAQNTSGQGIPEPAAGHGAHRSLAEPRMLADLAVHAPVSHASPPIPLVPEARGWLPWANATRANPTMVPVLEQADRHVRLGFQQLRRHAPGPARAEFLAALRLVAQASDGQQHTRFYSQALTAGFTALAESRDFLRPRPPGNRIEVARLVGNHQTPILKSASLDRLSPRAAAERYAAYAREQLAAAAAGEAPASLALFGLGQAALAQPAAGATHTEYRTAEATAIYQAALTADPGNFRAARELGLLVARRRSPPPPRTRSPAAAQGIAQPNDLARHPSNAP